MSGDRFIKLTHQLLDSEAWQGASLGCRCLILEIWKRSNGKNNGAIPYSVREVTAALRCGKTQAVRYLKEAQERGFIVAMKRGSFDGKGGGKATRWLITTEPFENRKPSCDFLKWSAK
jgi:hypothetical protein